jgi:hypothetical protein
MACVVHNNKIILVNNYKLKIMSVLTKNYKPIVTFNEEYSIGHSINARYLTSVAKYLMSKIKQSSKQYHEKHYGVKNNGKPGKEIRLTLDDIKRMVIESEGKSKLSGKKIFFGPIVVMENPTAALTLGFMTEDQKLRRPSIDRIVSSKKVYDVENSRLVTMAENMGRGNSDTDAGYSSEYATVTLEYKTAKVTLTECTSSYLVDVLKNL